MTSIAYIGFSETAVRALLGHDKLKLSAVLWEKGRAISPLIKNNIANAKCRFFEVSSSEEILSIAKRIECKTYIMYQCSCILSAEMVYQYAVFNIHPGSLETNRGANPIGWTILLQEPHTSMSLNRINEKIDSGLLVKEAVIEVLPQDDTRLLRNRMELQIPSLLDGLCAYLDDKTACRVISEGVYRRRIREEDFQIHPEKDSMEVISAKIRSQAEYRGAVLIVNKLKFYVRAVEQTGEVM